MTAIRTDVILVTVFLGGGGAIRVVEVVHVLKERWQKVQNRGTKNGHRHIQITKDRRCIFIVLGLDNGVLLLLLLSQKRREFFCMGNAHEVSATVASLAGSASLMGQFEQSVHPFDHGHGSANASGSIATASGGHHARVSLAQEFHTGMSQGPLVKQRGAFLDSFFFNLLSLLVIVIVFVAIAARLELLWYMLKTIALVIEVLEALASMPRLGHSRAASKRFQRERLSHVRRNGSCFLTRAPFLGPREKKIQKNFFHQKYTSGTKLDRRALSNDNIKDLHRCGNSIHYQLQLCSSQRANLTIFHS